MKIAVYYNLPPGGAKRALHGHVKGLLARGHGIELWRPPAGDDAAPAIGSLAPDHVVASNQGPPPWWEGGRWGTLRSPSRTMKQALVHAKACAQEVDAGGFDVCLSATDPIFGAPPLGRFLRTPSVLYLQEPHRWLYEANPDFPWLSPPDGSPVARRVLEPARLVQRSRRSRFEVDNARAFDVVLVNSLFTRETVLRVYGVSPRLCYLGIDVEAFHTTDTARENLVVGVGNLLPQKNAHALVAAVSRLTDPRPRIEWVAASVDPDYRRAIEERAQVSGVDLVIHTATSDATLVELLNRARVVVYTPRLEPFGLVPLEANACGAPVIGIAEGGVRETVVDGLNGLLVSSLEDELTSAIERLVRSPDLAGRLGAQGRRIVGERWTLHAAVDRVEAELQAAAAVEPRWEPGS